MGPVEAEPVGSIHVRTAIDASSRTRTAYVRWYATPSSRRFPKTQEELAKILADSDNAALVNTFLRDFIGFESDPAFGIDVSNAASEEALFHLADVIDAARINAQDPKHPMQAEWTVLFCKIVGHPIAADVDVSKMVLPEKPAPSAGRRVSRKGPRG